VHLFGEESVGSSHYGADVEVMLPVFNRHVKFVALGIEVGDNRIHLPVAVLVDDVAAVAFL